MTYTTLISCAQLHTLLDGGAPLAVFDCSFELGAPERGEQLYREGHLPGALYAHLDRDLSAPEGAARASGGRHPLPTREAFAAWLAGVGLAQDMQVVVYDRNASSQCARLWWMLKWVGHDAVALLDGGLQAWQAAGGALASGDEPARTPTPWPLRAPLRRLVDAAHVLAHLGDGAQTVVDARAPARFRGEVEPLDPVAGHIPGALNRPFSDNIALDGRFKPAALLRAEFDALLAGRDAAGVVHQCGSGVTALPNLLAMEIAGYAPSTLFAGSWSEWCADAGRPVARG